jgi:hypothetical protein
MVDRLAPREVQAARVSAHGRAHDASPIDEGRARNFGHSVAQLGSGVSSAAAPIQAAKGTRMERLVKGRRLDEEPEEESSRPRRAFEHTVGLVRDDKIGPETNKVGLPDALNTLVSGISGDSQTHADIGSVTSELSNIGTGVASGVNAPFALNDMTTAVRKRVRGGGTSGDKRALDKRALDSAERLARDGLGVAATIAPEALGSVLPGVGMVTVGARGKDTSQKALATAYLARRSRKLKRRDPGGAFEAGVFKRDRKAAKADIRSGRLTSAEGFEALAWHRDNLTREGRDFVLLREFRKEARKAVRNQGLDTAMLAVGQGTAPVSGGLSSVGGALGAATRQSLSQRNKVAKQISLLTDAPQDPSARDKLRHYGKLVTKNFQTKSRAKKLAATVPESARVDLPLSRRDELAKQAARAIVYNATAPAERRSDAGRAIKKAARMAGVSSKILRHRPGEDEAAAHDRIAKALRGSLLSSSSRGVLEQTVGAGRATANVTKTLGRTVARRVRAPAD